MDSITLHYDLSGMPTAQHKAGLAGIIMSIHEMQSPDRRRGKAALVDADIPTIDELTPDRAVLTLTEQSCQKLFDDCYASRMGRVVVEKPWANAETLAIKNIKRVDPKTQNEKEITLYVHPNLEPRNPFLARHLFREDPDDKQDLWYKLWRDMLFQIPRSKPTTRNPFKETVNGSCREGVKMWAELVRFDAARKKGQLRMINLSSSLLLGAQDSTAENVGFADRVDNVLALHFWPLAVLIYVPTQLKIDAADFSRSRANPVGYSLAIPDIANLKSFCSAYADILHAFRTNAKPQGYRPHNACVDMAAEGALNLLTQQAWLVSKKAERVQLSGVLHAVEYVHVEKQGNNVKTLSAGRVSPERGLLARYLRITTFYRSPLFRHCRLGSLLQRQRQPWWRGFRKLLETLPHELFLDGPNLPPLAWNYRRDVRLAFREDTDVKTFPIPNGDIMSTMTDEEPKSKSIEVSILDIVRTYIRVKAESKTKVKYESIRKEFEAQSKQQEKGEEKKKDSEAKINFEKASGKLAERLFLEIRSRHDDDFKAYFAEHFGGASQKYNLGRQSDFQRVCEQLITHPEDVRIMTLLALSACS